MTAQHEPAATTTQAKRRRISVAGFLSVGMAVMMFIAVGSVLAIAILGGSRNLATLLRDRIELTVSAIAERVDRHIGPVEAQTGFLAELVAQNPAAMNDPAKLAAVMRASLAALPQIMGMAYVTPDYRAVRVLRDSDDVTIEDWSYRPEIVASLNALRDGGGASWSPPYFSPIIRKTLIAYRQPVRSGERFLGMFLPGVTIEDLSGYLSQLSRDLDLNVFILYGRDHVLAHPTSNGVKFDYSIERPLPTLAEAGDPVLARIWSKDARRAFLVAPFRNTEAHYVVFGDLPIIIDRDFYVYAYRRLSRFGDPPWIVGSYISGRMAGNEVARFWYMAAAGLGVLVASIVVTIVLGRRLAAPIREISAYAGRVRDLKLDDMPPLPHNAVRELDEAADAFNAMVRALRWFQTYIPRALVDRLLRTRGGGQDAITSERRLTVMFTDIVGFSTLAEHMPAHDVAVLLNEHFALVGGCIERHEGTIDKYIGDCVMAFWSAPIEQPDHARRAYLAAKEIEARMRDYNEQRVSLGLDAIRMRIGMHSGRVVVGNIGFEGRINYTAVGDAVNVAQRIEQAGKEFPIDADVIVLASEETLSGIGEDATAINLGRVALRGREEQMSVYRLA